MNIIKKRELLQQKSPQNPFFPHPLLNFVTPTSIFESFFLCSYHCHENCLIVEYFDSIKHSFKFSNKHLPLLILEAYFKENEKETNSQIFSILFPNSDQGYPAHPIIFRFFCSVGDGLNQYVESCLNRSSHIREE